MLVDINIHRVGGLNLDKSFPFCIMTSYDVRILEKPCAISTPIRHATCVITSIFMTTCALCLVQHLPGLVASIINRFHTVLFNVPATSLSSSLTHLAVFARTPTLTCRLLSTVFVHPIKANKYASSSPIVCAKRAMRVQPLQGPRETIATTRRRGVVSGRSRGTISRH